MKMWKIKACKKSLLILGIAAALWLTGCGSKEDETGDPEQLQVSQETQVPSDTAEKEPEKETEAEALPLSVHTKKIEDYRYSEDGENLLIYLEMAEVTVSGDGYEALAEGVARWNTARQATLSSNADAAMESAKESLAELGEDFGGYATSQTLEIMRSDSKVLSLLDSGYENTGGERPLYFRTGVNFDCATGKELEIEDIMTDPEGFREEATQYLIYQLQETYGNQLFEGLEDTLAQMWEWGPDWYLDAAGIVLIFNEYAVVPYAAGIPEIHLSYKDFEQYIHPNYFYDGEAAVLRVPVNEELYLDLPSVDQGVAMILERVENEYDYSYSLWIGDNQMPIGEFPVLGSACLMQRSDGRTFIILDVDMASDDYETHLYEITNGFVMETDSLMASIDTGNINTESVNLEFRLNLLGTYTAQKYYYADADGDFATEEELFVLNYEANTLTTTRELPVEVAGEKTILPVGSHLRVTATDDRSRIYVFIEELDSEGILYFTRGEEIWDIYIDGVKEEEYFEILYYAG